MKTQLKTSTKQLVLTDSLDGKRIEKPSAVENKALKTIEISVALAQSRRISAEHSGAPSTEF